MLLTFCRAEDVPVKMRSTAKSSLSIESTKAMRLQSSFAASRNPEITAALTVWTEDERVVEDAGRFPSGGQPGFRSVQPGCDPRLGRGLGRR